MSKGREKHQQRLQELSLFGKDLARRSGRKCELCEASGTALSIYEVPPVKSEPDFDHCLFICTTCEEQINSPKLRDSDHWRCLNATVWSEVPAVQATSVALLESFSTDWAIDLKEMFFCDEETKAWADEIAKEVNH